MSRRMIRFGTVVLGLAMLAAAPTGVKSVTLICEPGWRGGASGQYGGVGFFVACDNGRGRARLLGTSGTAYSARVGIESDQIAADCFLTGDSATVDRTCGPIRLVIR
jgi:hypothetical protein